MHLYIHIPFCKQKCSYCNFHFSTQLHGKSKLIDAICQEMKLRKNEVQSPLETIYFGGGTPSVLTTLELGQIFNQIEKIFDIAPGAEITLEANPDDLNHQKINDLRNFPINRFSIGIQSFFDEDLRLMRRVHTAQEAESSIKRVQDAGFDNITIDLIYGSPTTTNQMWQCNLQKAIDFDVPHVSAYALTVEPRTILQHQISKNLINNIDDEKQHHQFDMLVKELTSNGFEHYEISNFGKKDFFSRHNSAYWQGKKYVGIGPSAHSYNGESRRWNIANNTKYLQAILQKKLPQEIEILSEKDILNELTMIGLRTNYGIDLGKIQSSASEELFLEWKQNLQPFLTEGKLIVENNKLFLNPKFRFFADGIASDLFIV